MTQEKTINVYKIHGHKIVVVYSRQGQQNPAEGDQICLQAQIRLPNEKINNFLVPSLRFGERCEFAGEILRRDWGYHDDGNYRRHNHQFFSSTWRDAMLKASSYVEEEIQRLKKVLDVRAQALTDAEG